MKKLISLVLALAMLFVIGLAYAADTITISVDSSGDPDENAADEVYTAYKIFDVVKAESITGDVTTDSSIEAQGSDEADTGYAYTIDTSSPWYSVVSTKLTDYITLTDIAGNSSKKSVSLKDGVANTEATAIAMAGILAANVPSGATGISVTLGESEEADPGYYLIVSSIGSNLILGTTDINITQKNTYPSIEKTEKDEDNDNYGDTVEVAVGDTIDYKVVVSVPDSAKVDITVTDTMFEGLTYDQTAGLTVKVDGTALTADTDYVVGDATAQSWILTIKPTDATKGKEVEITFKATVNDKSIGVADTSKKNEVKLDFSNFSQTDSVVYTTSASSIFKYDGATEYNADNVKKLSGVKFTLKEGNAEFTVSKAEAGYYYYDANGSSEVVTDDDGMIIIRGLDSEKTYTLTETKTNDGYNMLDAPVTLTLVKDDNTYSADPTSAQHNIPNNQGTVLPSTGGIGTTIFYVIGGILLVGAAIILVARHKASE